MGKTKYTTAFYNLILAFTFAGGVASAQQNNSLYFLDRVPQSAQLNPAHQPGCTVYVGFPGISSLEINAGNNALGFSDIFIQNSEANKLVTPLYSKEITTQTIDKLRKNNILSSGLQIDLASFGFKIRDSYITFGISDKVNINANIPKNLFRFAYEGIDVGKSYSFDNIGMNAMYYREYALGYSRKISDKIYFGVRGKLLFGKANISSRQTNITISEPEWETIEVSSSFNANVSVPHLNVYSDATGKLDSTDFRDFNKTSDVINDLVLLKKNRGYGIDLGFQFDVTEKVSISASILDLGYINWKSDVHNLSGGGNYSFHGIDLNRDDSTDIADELLDTLQDVYDVSVSSDPYNTMLTPKLYAGVSYTPNRFIKLGMLLRSEYVMKTFRQQVTGSLVLYPTQFFGATLSYTIADRLYDNLGVGLIFRTGPLQMYFMSDRIPLFWDKVKGDGVPFVPVYAKDFNLRFGINLVFGANARKKLLKDQPFLE